MDFDGMAMFSASKHADREKLSVDVTAWRQKNADKTIVEVRTMQSSDNEFHCVTIAIFYKNKK